MAAGRTEAAPCSATREVVVIEDDGDVDEGQKIKKRKTPPAKKPKPVGVPAASKWWRLRFHLLARQHS